MAAIGGGLDIGTNALSYYGAKDANRQNLQSVRDQMDFQERMFKNRYQYQMNDMRAAGLNPLLAFGSAPPLPSGGSASAQQNPFGRLSRFDIPQVLSNIELNKANTAKALNEAKVASAQADLTKVNTANSALQSQQIANTVAQSTADTLFAKKHPVISSGLDVVNRLANAFHGTSSGLHKATNAAHGIRNYRYGVLK